MSNDLKEDFTPEPMSSTSENGLSFTNSVGRTDIPLSKIPTKVATVDSKSPLTNGTEIMQRKSSSSPTRARQASSEQREAHIQCVYGEATVQSWQASARAIFAAPHQTTVELDDEDVLTSAPEASKVEEKAVRLAPKLEKSVPFAPKEAVLSRQKEVDSLDVAALSVDETTVQYEIAEDSALFRVLRAAAISDQIEDEINRSRHSSDNAENGLATEMKASVDNDSENMTCQFNIVSEQERPVENNVVVSTRDADLSSSEDSGHSTIKSSKTTLSNPSENSVISEIVDSFEQDTVSQSSDAASTPSMLPVLKASTKRKKLRSKGTRDQAKPEAVVQTPVAKAAHTRAEPKWRQVDDYVADLKWKVVDGEFDDVSLVGLGIPRASNRTDDTQKVKRKPKRATVIEAPKCQSTEAKHSHKNCHISQKRYFARQVKGRRILERIHLVHPSLASLSVQIISTIIESEPPVKWDNYFAQQQPQLYISSANVKAWRHQANKIVVPITGKVYPTRVLQSVAQTLVKKPEKRHWSFDKTCDLPILSKEKKSNTSEPKLVHLDHFMRSLVHDIISASSSDISQTRQPVVSVKPLVVKPPLPPRRKEVQARIQSDSLGLCEEMQVQQSSSEFQLNNCVMPRSLIEVSDDELFFVQSTIEQASETENRALFPTCDIFQLGLSDNSRPLQNMDVIAFQYFIESLKREELLELFGAQKPETPVRMIFPEKTKRIQRSLSDSNLAQWYNSRTPKRCLSLNVVFYSQWSPSMDSMTSTSSHDVTVVSESHPGNQYGEHSETTSNNSVYFSIGGSDLSSAISAVTKSPTMSEPIPNGDNCQMGTVVPPQVPLESEYHRLDFTSRILNGFSRVFGFSRDHESDNQEVYLIGRELERFIALQTALQTGLHSLSRQQLSRKNSKTERITDLRKQMETTRLQISTVKSCMKQSMVTTVSMYRSVRDKQIMLYFIDEQRNELLDKTYEQGRSVERRRRSSSESVDDVLALTTSSTTFKAIFNKMRPKKKKDKVDSEILTVASIASHGLFTGTEDVAIRVFRLARALVYAYCITEDKKIENSILRCLLFMMNYRGAMLAAVNAALVRQGVTSLNS